jgi:hypothetical protein
MRSILFPALAACALGLGVSQPAAAWDDTHGSGTIYVHHHVYAAPRYRHVYHLHKPGPRHVHVVHYPGHYYGWRHRHRETYLVPSPAVNPNYFGPHRYWYWRGYSRTW